MDSPVVEESDQDPWRYDRKNGYFCFKNRRSKVLNPETLERARKFQKAVFPCQFCNKKFERSEIAAHYVKCARISAVQSEPLS